MPKAGIALRNRRIESGVANRSNSYCGWDSGNQADKPGTARATFEGAIGVILALVRIAIMTVLRSCLGCQVLPVLSYVAGLLPGSMVHGHCGHGTGNRREHQSGYHEECDLWFGAQSHMVILEGIQIETPVDDRIASWTRIATAKFP